MNDEWWMMDGWCLQTVTSKPLGPKKYIVTQYKTQQKQNISHIQQQPAPAQRSAAWARLRDSSAGYLLLLEAPPSVPAMTVDDKENPPKKKTWKLESDSNEIFKSRIAPVFGQFLVVFLSLLLLPQNITSNLKLEMCKAVPSR